MRFPARDDFAARLAIFYAAIFVFVGINMPFFPLWLEAKGFDAQTIGILLAIPMVIRVLAIPTVTKQADLRSALRLALIICCLATMAGYLLVGVSSGVWLVAITFSLASAAYSPIVPLSDTYALTGLARRGRPYGTVRLWGSAAFIFGNLFAGFALGFIPARHLVWLMAAAAGVAALAAIALRPLDAPPPPPEKDAKPEPLMRNSGLMLVICAAALIQSSHAVYYSFSTLQWTERGLSGTAVALLWGLGVAAEIVLFAYSGRLPRALMNPTVLLMMGGAGALLRWGVMMLDPPAASLPFLQVLHAVTFGTTHLGALGYLARHAPQGQAATAQGMLSTAMGLAMAAATGLSGVLFARYGSAAYAAMALAGVAGCACAALAHHRTGKLRG